MKVMISINCDNAAFQDDIEMELAKCLKRVCDRAIKTGLANVDGMRVSDSNGNRVGLVAVSK